MICIGVKYCGGCVPGYDRPALVEQIKGRLSGIARFVSWQNPDTDITLVAAGCPNACADIQAFCHKPVYIMRRPADAEFLINLIKSENLDELAGLL